MPDNSAEKIFYAKVNHGSVKVALHATATFLSFNLNEILIRVGVLYDIRDGQTFVN